MSGIKCEYCGKFIAYRDFDEGRVAYTPIVASDTDPLEPTEPAPICPKCQEKET